MIKGKEDSEANHTDEETRRRDACKPSDSPLQPLTIQRITKLPRVQSRLQPQHQLHYTFLQ